MQRHLYYNLTENEPNMLKLVDFRANQRWEPVLRPGSETAMGILRDCWARWFGTRNARFSSYKPDIYWIPWSFFMDDEKIEGIKNDLVANLFNDEARISLYNELNTSKKLNDQLNYFNFNDEDPMLWNKVAYQQRVVDFSCNINTPRQPTYWALGNFTINALPAGTVIPLDGGGHRICVDDVYLFIHDRFNFEGLAYLGMGDTVGLLFPAFSGTMRSFWNSDFRKFRDKYGYGRDFTVMSPLYRLPDFEGQCWDVK